MSKSILTGILIVFSLVSMSFAGNSMFFDAQSTLGTTPASLNWNDTTAWWDHNGSGAPFGYVPTAANGDNAFIMNGAWNGTGDDPANNMAIVDSDASALGLWIGYWGQASSMNVENGANLNITNQST
ncbi:MAG: hypothetical protein LLF92_05525, partial [Planctomycetaceae bacterium]|nr:hypothetical protein [Planctomycetaceae bacterium]